MNSLQVHLKNCYGISEFDEEFFFEKSNANLIYAANGTMKTSFAKTFSQIASGKKPEEKLLGRIPEYQIKLDGEDIRPEQIFVVHPFDGEYESKNLSTLLVNSVEKEKYDLAFKSVLDIKVALITTLNRLTKIRKEDIEKTMSSDLKCTNLIDSIRYLRENPRENDHLHEVRYSEIFDERVTSLLKSDGIAAGIEKYTKKYNELIEKSTIYCVGKFNPANAESIAKALKKEKFFDASHKILMNLSNQPIGNAKDLDNLLENSKAEIFKDKELNDIHTKILSGVASVKNFQLILEKSPNISAYLSDLDELKKRLWYSYYYYAQEEFDALVSQFDLKKSELVTIETNAGLEGTLWHEAKNVFKRRFHVPFNIDVEDHVNVILGTSAPNMIFTFPGEHGDEIRFNRGQISSLDILSIGERRAMYLLNIIFEFKARIKKGEPTLVIIDDIADSFDYKNKFAIMEYLRELCQEPMLRIIALTHNYDFYRTFQGRILDKAKWDNSFLARRTTTNVKLVKGFSKQVSSPFEHWRKNYTSEAPMFISMIPFVRNLIEYKEGTSSARYSELTSMLHIKDDTHTFTLDFLFIIINEVIGIPEKPSAFDHSTKVQDFVYATADFLCTSLQEDEISLEKKITISIAIRLKAEEFMWGRVTNKQPITTVQTGKLYDRFCKEYVEPKYKNEINVLDQVILMTPENIHLNSFMYEPLLDISNVHLIDLYKNVLSLKV